MPALPLAASAGDEVPPLQPPPRRLWCGRLPTLILVPNWRECHDAPRAVLACMSRSFSTTSSVLLIRRFCSVCIFWIISYVLGSLPSSLRHLQQRSGAVISGAHCAHVLYSCGGKVAAASWCEQHSRQYNQSCKQLKPGCCGLPRRSAASEAEFVRRARLPHLWTLSGLSSSSLRAFTLVRSCSSWRPRLATCARKAESRHRLFVWVDLLLCLLQQGAH